MIITNPDDYGNIDGELVLAISYRGNRAPVAPDAEKMKYYYEMAAAHGSSACAIVLGQQYVRGKILPQDCSKAVYYHSIGSLLNKDANSKEKDQLLVLKERLIEGALAFDDEVVVTKSCLTEAEAERAVAESKPAFAAAKAARDKEKAAHDALYNAARQKLPALKAAYEQAIRDSAKSK